MKNNNKNHNKRKVVVALLAGLAVTGIVGASAASLGGIRSSSLGADVADVASCDDTGVDVSYAASYAPDTADRALDVSYVTGVTIAGVNEACDGLAYEVSLLGARGSVLGQDTGTVGFNLPAGVATDDESFDVAFAPGIDAEQVVGISIVISG